MNRFVKAGLIAASGIGIAYALNKMSDEIEAQKAETQAALKSAETKYNQLQAYNAAASTAVENTNELVQLPNLTYSMLTGSTGNNVEQRQALLAWILNNVPQQCQFTGLYQPDQTHSIRGYKYKSNLDINKCYIGVEVWSIFKPGLITTFGIKRGEYFEEQIGG